MTVEQKDRITALWNSASDMEAFCNQFDRICTAAGCAVIYWHNHSKGAQGMKKAMDRASGSGVFARDPDAQLDIIELEMTEEVQCHAAEEIEQKRERIGAAIRLISDPVSQRCLILHYLENRGWKEVAAIMRYSPIQTYRYRISGYTELENFLKHAPDGIKS